MKTFLLLILFAAVPSTFNATQETNDSQLTAAQTTYEAQNESILVVLKNIQELQISARNDRERIKKMREEHVSKALDEELSNEYGAMLQIAENTHQDPIRDDWNLFGWVTFAIAAISAFYAIITYRAQKQTEEHTTNAPIDVQLWKLKDLPRHFYRNLICTCAIIYRYKAEGREKQHERYPSEGNLRKLQTMPDDIVLPIDVDKTKEGKDNPYSLMHELKLLLRNYNVEVEVASEHLARKTISDDSLAQDFDNLLFKPLFLTQSTFRYEESLTKADDSGLVSRTIYCIMQEHFKKLKVGGNFNMLFNDAAQACLQSVLKHQTLHFHDAIDRKDSVDRSVGTLLGYVLAKDEAEAKREGIEPHERIQEDGITYVRQSRQAEIGRAQAIDILTSPDALGESTRDYLTAITSVTDAGHFVSFYERFYLGTAVDDEKRAALERLYQLVSPYLDYLQKEDTWEFHTLLKYMLAVDAAIEADRIGMINFS